MNANKERTNSISKVNSSIHTPPKMTELKLPQLISDGLVLQRDRDVNIWGWAAPGETVTVDFLGETFRTTVDEGGKWRVVLSPQKAGGPYEMKIESGTCITVKDILIGDVWVCSGQSNMVLPMGRVSDLYAEDIAQSYNPAIRLFTVPDRYDFNIAHEDLSSGGWEKADPESILRFTATGYFFAKALFERYHVPIGLINASVGGSPVEAWLSGESLEKFPRYKEVSDPLKDNSYIEKIKNEEEAVNKSWYDSINETDPGLAKAEPAWFSEEYDASDWPTMGLPAFWEDERLGRLHGVVWFRKEFHINPEMEGKPARLLLGRIVDSDSAYVNGILVGTTSYQYPPRRYDIPTNVLKAGKNVITVRVVNTAGKGGFIKDKPYKIMVEGKEIVDLTGPWQYRVGVTANPLPETTFFQYKPLGLFNGMIAPLINFTIKGILWYQGESNIRRTWDYRELFAELINDWRKKWNQGSLPFLYVQLSNYLELEDLVAKRGWPEIREAQRKVLSVPTTGMAVTIDVGEWNDLHPLNKKAVGSRLALLARKIAYGEDTIVSSGPIYKSMTVERNRLILHFEKDSGKLASRDGKELRHFEIAGANEEFINARAIIENNNVVVWNDLIDSPVAVRYAWVDHPEGANLFNEEELPASPFKARTE